MIGCLIVGLVAGYGLSRLGGQKTSPGFTGAPQGFPPPAPDPALEQQIKLTQQAVDSDPKNLQALVGLANLYYDTGNFSNAITYYERALAINPNDPNILTDLGTSYRNLKQTDKAIELFKRAMKADPRHPNSRFNLGVVLLHDKNDVRGAIAAWEDFLRLDPNNPQAPNLREQIQKMKQSIKG